ncbi:MAG: hypothetical protein A3H29_04075 [Acidobacteria bacterium RIFCSPLOWO2_02_FULL_67_21]|nr:MAG: hypothetical protein A3H29_04075 [Acidobacteria bacterium RIFCSPLOWO2_02_FULL_67_21]
MRTFVAAFAAAAVFAITWLFRFNDPNGSFAGLTDDHFFYVVRGWQILYGDLPVRDFVDNGAPLHYYVAAAVQLLFGRGTLSELAFGATMIAAGTAVTYWLAARASGSMLLGLCAALILIWLSPRFYNYPKIVVYAAAIPLLWRYVDRPGRWPRFWLALTTAAAFLLRHDHGVFVACAVTTMLALQSGVSWRERIRSGAVYGLLTLALLAPYLVFTELNGGVVRHFSDALEWSARERERTEIIWPGLFDYPDGVSDEATTAPLPLGPVWVVRDNATAWWYYLELALPFLSLVTIALSADAFRPGWPHARVKLAIVAVLAVVLNAGFLRSPLGARLADPAVPHTILIAWLIAAVPAMFWRPPSWRPALRRWRMALAVPLGLASVVLAFVIVATMSRDVLDRFDGAGLTEGVGRALRGAAATAGNVRRDWDLAHWAGRPDRPDLITLAMYVQACTRPDARVFVQPYIPQVLALARRPFAGGHADLRTGFFDSEEKQALTISRLQRQYVPVALLGESLEGFTTSFPLVGAYLQNRFTVAGTHTFDDRFEITLLLGKDERPTGRFTDLDWPCLR